jgi:type IV secretory pathway VirD2 relaxase
MDDERPFRIHPRRPRQGRDESKVWARGFKQLVHLVRMTTKPLSARFGRFSRSGGRTRLTHNQRCAVRVTYTKNKIRGQWAAHGRYIVRESATALNPDGKAFGSSATSTAMPELLAAWQKAGDQRLFKLILSPEFGERMELERLTRDVMAGMETDLGKDLEWAAVIHRNTEHPHVHVVLRGIATGVPFRLPREYVQRGIRDRAEAAGTAQLGYRTSLDMQAAEEREVAQARFTSLDRILSRGVAVTPEASPTFEVSRLPDSAGLSDFARAREQRLVARLNYLTEIGLAERCGPLRWNVRRDFACALRTFQRAQDRQKMLAQYASFLSDPRIQFRVVASDTEEEIDGRVIAHVLDEMSDRPHALIEGVDGVAYYVPHDEAIGEARANGKLRPNAFVQLRTEHTENETHRTVVDLGDADQLLSDPQYLKTAAGRIVQRGACEDDPARFWGGWLGRYHAALQNELAVSTRTLEPSQAQRKASDRDR